MARLERETYVHRRPDPADGRYTLAALTDEGYEKIVNAAPGHFAEVRAWLWRAVSPTPTRVPE